MNERGGKRRDQDAPRNVHHSGSAEPDARNSSGVDAHDPVDPAEPNEWRSGFGAYGLSRDTPPHGRGSNRRSEPEQAQRTRTGYGEQGFGTGERRGWGGGPRGGYGGGEPGGMHGGRGGGWAAGEQRYERGRGPRSWGPDGWGAEAPWRHSEFAGRGEFGSVPPSGRTEEDGLSTGTAADAWAPRDHWNVPGPYSGRGPEGYRRSEIAIREDVCERLTRHGEIDASRISVRVENNEVILEGYVDSRAAKRMAEDTAESVSGVRDVHNRLRID